MQTDLPLPVVPAMSICGSFAMLPMMALPPMSLPMANDRREEAFWKAGEEMMSRR